MPARAASICRAPGCGCRIDAPGYCERHQHLAVKWTQRQARLGGTTKRGYGWQWQQLRSDVLKRDKGLCQPCLRAGRVTLARHVDHIKAKAHGGTDDPANLQSICWPCHKVKTAQERLRQM